MAFTDRIRAAAGAHRHMPYNPHKLPKRRLMRYANEAAALAAGAAAGAATASSPPAGSTLPSTGLSNHQMIQLSKLQGVMQASGWEWVSNTDVFALLKLMAPSQSRPHDGKWVAALMRELGWIKRVGGPKTHRRRGYARRVR